MDKSEAGKLGWLAGEKTRDRQKIFRRKKYLENPNTCANCSAIISYDKKRNKFCSHSCAAQLNNSKRPSKILDKKCQMCTNIISRGSSKYCSNKCQGRHTQKKLWSKWLESGITKGSQGTVKKFLLHQHGSECSICGLTEWLDNPVPLVMDHINGNPEDNRIVNLRLVCGNCDMQLPTYKSKNKGNGRHNRRQRYKEGRSY